MLLFGLLLWGLPIVTLVIFRKFAPQYAWSVAGIVLGTIIVPASLALYALYYAGPILAIFGMLGLIVHLFHAAPAPMLLNALWPEIHIEIPESIINTIIWSIVYGAIGWGVDRRNKKAKANIRPNAA